MKIGHVSVLERSALSFGEIHARVKAGEKIFEYEGDYLSIRIPGIIEASDGSLLAYYECRTGGDWSAIDLCAKRSEDGGLSWSERMMLVSGKGRMTCNNPVMIVDGERIHFLYCEGYKRLFHRVSYDNGRTFGAPHELTETVDNEMGEEFWSNLAVGPGHGIRLESGRLIVPLWMAHNKKDIFSHSNSSIRTLYSDDHGVTWHIGCRVENGEILDPNESTVCEIGGRLMLNIRNKAPERLRAVAFSEDGGESFTPMTLVPDLPDPKCMGALTVLDGRVFFSNCRSHERRINLSVSELDGDSSLIHTTLITPIAGYSDLVASPSGKCLYSLCEADDCTEIRFAQILLDEDERSGSVQRRSVK